MTFIKSRKHSPLRHLPQQTLGGVAAATLVAFAAPAMAQTGPAGGGTLKEVRVRESAGSDYKETNSASPKFTAPLLDTPQTVQVIKEDLFKEQGATTLTEALRNTPGVATFFLGENGSTNTGDAVFLRGFDTSNAIFVDGVRDLGSISRDVFNVQQVEVVKGPAGADIGRTAPTGYINLISKQPTLDNAVSGSVGFGTSSYGRASVDLNRVLSATDGTAFRLNAVGLDTGVDGRDVVKNKRWGIAPSIAFGLNTPTRLTLNYLHVQQNNTPDGGVPTVGLPGYTTPDALAYGSRRTFLNTAAKVNPRNFYGTTSDFDDVTADMLTVRFEHDFSPNLTVRNTTRYGKTTEDYMLTSFMAGGYPATGPVAVTAGFLATPNPNDPSTWTVTRNLPTNKYQINTILVNQTNVTAKLESGGIKHSLIGGLELIREEQRNDNFFGQGFASVAGTTAAAAAAGSWPVANFYNPNPNVSGYKRLRNGTGTDGTTETVALYLFDTAQLSPQWQITGGLRYDHYSTNFFGTALSTTAANPTLPVGTIVPTTLGSSDGLFSFKLGLVYKPQANGSIYAGYATSQQPPGGSNFTLSAAANNAGNPNFDPQKATTLEVGTKWELMGDKLALTAALYRTDISNDIEVDPTNATVFLQTGKKRVQGLELSAVGQVTRELSVSVGYTTMDSSVVSGAHVGADASSDALNYTPKDAFTSWLSYKLPFGLTLAGGARYNGKLQARSDGAVGTPQYTDSYWVVDAMASYRINKNIDLQFNVYNLSDEVYVAAINKSGFRYTPGTPRSARLTANFTF